MDKKTIDTTVTSGSSNLITSGAVYTAINSDSSPAIADISAAPTYVYDNSAESDTANIEVRWSVPNTSAIGSQTATVYARMDSITGDSNTERAWKGAHETVSISNSILKSGKRVIFLNYQANDSPIYTKYSITVTITLSGGSVFNKQVIY